MADQNRDEELLSRMVSQLPARRAPASLQLRVLEEMQRRAALPWWRRGFANWPLAARAAFTTLCGAIVGLTFLGSWAGAGARALQEVYLVSMSWTQPAIAAVASAAESAALLRRVIPPSWLYGSLAVAAVLYAVLLGLGAAAYHTLYRPRSMEGQQS